ncbi:hypothetical protein PMI38_00302 [Pseudomonas sp. GM84]|uniref:hypothetical protein n=1 Tax=Pseudomonas sp. GM84 TaxID=1144340 RepID=UPI00026F55BD|nr:hypothetical protein [Pseudomonas sp. GM84]EJN40179.1 hypothetical protein PMI38_00302 [Pseudomonas sp. GM84]
MAKPREDKRNRILDPVDRVTEVIFGLLMAMTFVGTLSVATAGREEVRTMLYAALGCNLAWGLADAVMYLLRTWTERTRNRNFVSYLKHDASEEEGRVLIADALPSRIAVIANPQVLEMLRQRLVEYADQPVRPRLGPVDVLGSLGVFSLVVLATFPVVIPFLLTNDAALALRASNLVALALLFICGWLLARHSGGYPMATGLAFAILGTALMFGIIALGG